jgi:ribose transport system permease protein
MIRSRPLVIETDDAIKTTGSDQGRRWPMHPSSHQVARWSLLGLTVALVLFFTLLPATGDVFPTVANARVTFANQSVLAVLALGALVPLVTREFDLSVGATLGLSSIVAAKLMSTGTPLVLAMLLAVGVGSLVGLVNGLLITRAGVNSIITTFATATVVAGIAFWVSGGEATVSGIPSVLTDVGTQSLLGIPAPIWIVALLAASMYYFLAHTPYGRYLYALGSNPAAAVLVGLNPRRLLLSAFVIAGAFAGVASILQLAVSGAATPQVGGNLTLPTLAAAFLSAAAVKLGQVNVGGLLVSVAFLAVLNSGLNLAGAEAYVNDIANGVAVIAGVALSSILGRLGNSATPRNRLESEVGK